MSFLHLAVTSPVTSVFINAEGTPSLSPDATPDAGGAVSATVDILQLALGGILGFAVGVFVVLLVQGIMRHLLRRKPTVLDTIRPTMRPTQLAIGLLGAWLAISYMIRAERPSWYSNALHVFVILEIIAVTWFVASAVKGVEQAILASVRESSQSRYRKVQTQMQILQRVITVVIWVCGFAAVLLTFPDARTLGASLLASAGVVSVVAGIAAQSTLGNVFAGLQLAFSDSIRVGDIVFWETERCSVEEITLTYVVLRVWDGRRFIVPSSKMTSTTFENWTRRSSELIDHIDFRLDWAAPIPEIRAYLMHLLESTDLWDGRIGVLQVRDTDNEYIQVSALISAKNSSTMIDLRSYIREEMVTWLQSTYPEALPHVRYFNYNFEEDERPGGRENKVQELSLVSPVSPHDSSVATVQPSRDVDGHDSGKQDSGKKDSDKPSPKQSPRDLEETAVLSLEERGLSADQPERVPIAQRDIPDTGEVIAQEDRVEQAGKASPKRHGHESSIFTGSLEAEARAEEFESAGALAAAERSEDARRRSQRAHEEESAEFSGESSAEEPSGAKPSESEPSVSEGSEESEASESKLSESEPSESEAPESGTSTPKKDTHG